LRDRESNRPRATLFFVAAFGLSWGFWALAALYSIRDGTLLTQVLHYAGGLGPFAVTIALIYWRHTPEFRRDFWRRTVEFRQIDARWYGVVLLTVPVMTASGALVDKLLGGEGLELAAAERFVAQPWMFLPFALLEKIVTGWSSRRRRPR